MKIHLEIIFQFFPPLKKGIKGPEDITYYVTTSYYLHAFDGSIFS